MDWRLEIMPEHFHRTTKQTTGSVWDSWPKLEPDMLSFLYASDDDMDEDAKAQREYEEKVMTEEGLEKGFMRLADEELELLIERLNALQRYVQNAEDWKEFVHSEYIMIRKKQPSQSPDSC